MITFPNKLNKSTEIFVKHNKYKQTSDQIHLNFGNILRSGSRGGEMTEMKSQLPKLHLREIRNMQAIDENVSKLKTLRQTRRTTYENSVRLNKYKLIDEYKSNQS